MSEVVSRDEPTIDSESSRWAKENHQGKRNRFRIRFRARTRYQT